MRRLVSRGVELLNGPMDRPWGIRTASFRDPRAHLGDRGVGPLAGLDDPLQLPEHLLPIGPGVLGLFVALVVVLAEREVRLRALPVELVDEGVVVRRTSSAPLIGLKWVNVRRRPGSTSTISPLSS